MHKQTMSKIMDMKKELTAVESEDKARLAILDIAHMMSVPMSLVAVINLKVPDALWQDGSNTPLSATQILHHIRPNGGGDVENLQRILRLLTSYHIFAEHLTPSGQRKYSLTDIGKTLVSDRKGKTSYAPYMLQHHQEELMRAWKMVGEAVEDPMAEIFEKANGEGVVSYYMKKPDATDSYCKAVYGISVPFMREMLEYYDGFQGVETLVDVGGNTGACLHMIMSKYPSIRNGINFDLPHFIAVAPQIPGITHVAGDAFESIPSGDAIFMKWIYLVWTDEECALVLRKCYEALPVNGKLIVSEPVAPELTDDSQRTRTLLGGDIFVMTTYRTTKGGHRTEKQFKELGISAGFSGFNALYVDSYFAVLEFLK